MIPFWTPTRFQFLNDKLYFCLHVTESANIVELFAKKLSGILGLSLCIIFLCQAKFILPFLPDSIIMQN